MRPLRLLLLGALALGGCFGACQDRRSPEQKQREELLPLLFKQRLAAIAKGPLDAARLVEQRCPAPPAAAGPALAFDRDATGYFFDPKFDGDAKEHWPLRLIMSTTLHSQLAATNTFSLTHELYDARERWYAALLLEKRERPVADEAKKQFTEGRVSGWLVFYDQQGTGPLCQVRFDARSSERVKYAEQLGPTFTRAVCEDMIDRIEAELDRSSARVGGPKVEVAGHFGCLLDE